MRSFLTALGEVFDGDIETRSDVLETYSTDASVFTLTPDAVVYPKSAHDIRRLVQFVSRHKHEYPGLSVTPRGAGTCMSGGPLSHSIVVDVTRHLDKIHGITSGVLHVEPGAYMRNIDPLVAEHHALIGSVPASRALCTIGGMVGNNSGGERSLEYGNTARSVRKLNAVLADGKEYTFEPLNKSQLNVKLKADSFEGEVYRQVYDMVDANYDTIRNARPHVSKNSMGYSLWDIWDREEGVFDMTQLLTGSQGTLGVITDIHIQTHPKPPHNGLLVAYVNSTAQLGKIIPTVMKHNPVTFEGFDDVTFNLGITYFNTFRKQLGTKEWLKQQAMLSTQAARFRGHLPSVVLMIEFDGESVSEIDAKIAALQADLKKFKLKTTIEHDDHDSALFWGIRRASLSLLRNRVHGKYAAPFIDDLTVQPRYIHEFLPKLRRTLRRYELPATIAGHFGDGNFHIIPLISLESAGERAKLEPILRDIIPLIQQYGGTLAGEHNDGMIRGPWLPAMFGDEMYSFFKQTKEIFDPLNIFNPHKKTDADWDYSLDHMRHTSKPTASKN